jgi:hypothetical protein
LAAVHALVSDVRRHFQQDRPIPPLPTIFFPEGNDRSLASFRRRRALADGTFPRFEHAGHDSRWL